MIFLRTAIVPLHRTAAPPWSVHWPAGTGCRATVFRATTHLAVVTTTTVRMVAQCLLPSPCSSWAKWVTDLDTVPLRWPPTKWCVSLSPRTSWACTSNSSNVSQQRRPPLFPQVIMVSKSYLPCCFVYQTSRGRIYSTIQTLAHAYSKDV